MGDLLRKLCSEEETVRRDLSPVGNHQRAGGPIVGRVDLDSVYHVTVEAKIISRLGTLRIEWSRPVLVGPAAAAYSQTLWVRVQRLPRARMPVKGFSIKFVRLDQSKSRSVVSGPDLGNH